MIRVAIIGNCQASALRQCLSRSRSVSVVGVLDVNVSGQEDFIRSTETVLTRNDVDIVVSHQMSDEFGHISSNNLRSLYGDSYLTLTNIYFHGLHPDLSYYGSFTRRVQSPLGDYHSKLAITCFLKGYTIEQCLQHFRGPVYEKMGYLGVYDASKRELLDRDELNSIKFAQDFFQICQTRLPLLSVNHPTSLVIAGLAQAILSKVADGQVIPEEFFANGLSDGTVWPIYPEIREAFRLPYSTPMMFYPSNGSAHRAMTLEEFVQHSYRLYAEIGREGMLEVPLGRVLLDAALT